MKTFSEIESEHRRITILRAIETAQGQINESMLLQVVNEFGVATSHDKLRSELSWLKENGYVEIEIVADVWIAKITLRGLDVAQGLTTVPGIKHPTR